MKNGFLLLIVFLFSGFFCFAQDKENSDDSTYWTNSKEHDWSFDDFEFAGKPTIETSYGVANIGLKSINSSFMKVGMAELRLGYAKQKPFNDYIVKYSNQYLLLGNLSADLNSKSGNSVDLEPEMWKVGAGSISGYGYTIGSSSIIPYHSASFTLTRLNVKNLSLIGADSLILTPKDKENLELFNQSFRFGTTSEGGIRIHLVPIIALNAAYERSVIFPRVLFWKLAGSVILEGIATGAIDAFVKEIMDDSPAAGPIANFLLKNALSFGMQQLRHEKMNWPFNSVEPLYTDTWKVGITFTF
jgi:hypothetical protein